MVPAMDRFMMTPGRRSSVGLGLALAVSLLDLGCARLPWKKSTPEPPMLGRVSDTTDIYAMSRRPTGPAVAVTSSEVGTVAAGSAFEEVGMAVRPVETNPSGVALQSPTAMEAHPSSKSASGVPNASLVLASGERPIAPKPDAITPAQLVAEARSALDAMSNYEVSLHRQERINGQLLPEEDIVLAIRRNPKAVRLTWSEGPNQGREVLYRSDEPGGSMHVKMANPALPRMTLTPESPLVMRNSRHPVTEAGLDSIIEGLENSVKAADASHISYAGLEAAEGLTEPHHCLTQNSSTGDQWRIYLDPTTQLPSLVMARDAAGDLLERNLFRNVRPNLPELASDDAFDTIARWGKPAGLFGRLSRNDAAESSASPR